MRLKLLTLNIHKGFSSYRRREILNDLREAIRESKADLVFLQEVAWRKNQRQAEFLADSVWQDHAYGRNAVYNIGHHGNAILSKYNFRMSMNVDISSSAWEKRGFLYACVYINDTIVHLITSHLSLRAKDRRVQANALRRFICSLPPSEPVVLAGDFNDWGLELRKELEAPLQLIEAHRSFTGHEARTFPSYFPFLKLDRIYVRGFQIASASTFTDKHWPRLSDHLGLMADVER